MNVGEGVKKAVVDISTPLAYQLGKQVFMGLEFLVDQRVLIPRESSVALVDAVVALAEAATASPPTGVVACTSVLDLGTGSGCLVVAALKALADCSSGGGGGGGGGALRGVGVDLDQDALDLAAQNVQRLGLGGQVKLGKGSFSDLPHDPVLSSAPFSFVLCNPPYRERKSAARDMFRSVRSCEPENAMYVPDGEDRLVFYREVCKSCRRHGLVRAGGGALIFEAPPDLADRVASLLVREGYRDVRVTLDVHRMRRCVFGVRE